MFSRVSWVSIWVSVVMPVKSLTELVTIVTYPVSLGYPKAGQPPDWFAGDVYVMETGVSM